MDQLYRTLLYHIYMELQNLAKAAITRLLGETCAYLGCTPDSPFSEVKP